MHCNLKAVRHRDSHSGMALANFVVRMRRNCYYWASGQNSVRTNMAVRYFLHCTNLKCAIFYISGVFHPMILFMCYGLWSLKINANSTKDDIIVQHIAKMSLCCEVISSFVIFAVLDLRVGGCRPQKVL